MFGDEESRSKKPRNGNEEEEPRRGESIEKDKKTKDDEMEKLLDENLSHAGEDKIENLVNQKNGRMNHMEMGENNQISFQMNPDNVVEVDSYTEISEPEEEIEGVAHSSGLNEEGLTFFNEKYSQARTSSRIPSERNKEFQPSSASSTIQLTSDLDSKAPGLQNGKENTKKNAPCKQNLDNCSVNERRDESCAQSSSQVHQHKHETNSSFVNGSKDNVAASLSTRPIPESKFSDLLYSNPVFDSNLLVNSLQDTTTAIPTSAHSTQHSGFSDRLNSHPTFLGSLVTHNGTVYYQPAHNVNPNPGFSLPHFSPGVNYHCYIMVRSDPNSTSPILNFPVSSFQGSLTANCGQLTTSVISLDSLQRICSCITASSVNNPNSILSIPVNRPVNLGLAPTTCTSNVTSLDSIQRILSGIMVPRVVHPDSAATIPVNQPTIQLAATNATCSVNAVSFESLQNTLSAIMVPSSINPNSTATIPVNQHALLQPTCGDSATSKVTQLIFSTKDATSNDSNKRQDISINSNVIDTVPVSQPTSMNPSTAKTSISSGSKTTSSSKDSNKRQDPTSPQVSICTPDSVETMLRTGDQSCMQDPRPFGTLRDHVNPGSRSSGLSRMYGNAESISQAENQAFIGKLQDHNRETIYDNQDRSSEPSHLLICARGPEEHIILDKENRCSIIKTENTTLSTPEDKSQVCESSESFIFHACAEVDKASSTNIPQDCSVPIPVDVAEALTTLEEKEGAVKKNDDLAQERIVNQGAPQNRKESTSSSSSNKHQAPRDSTFIRVSPRYSETSGCCSPLVRVSKNVSPLQPIRGNIQQYVITHGHDKRWVAEKGLEEVETGERGKIRKPIYLKGTPPQGYRRRLLSTARTKTTCAKKIERKTHRCSDSFSNSTITGSEDGISKHLTETNTTSEDQESSGLAKSLEERTAKQAEAPCNLDTQKTILGSQTTRTTWASSDPKTILGSQTTSTTWASSDPKAILGSQAPKESCTPSEEDTRDRNPRTRSRSLICSIPIASQRRERSSTSNNPDDKKTGSPNSYIRSDPKTPMNTRTPNETPSSKDSQTPQNQKIPMNTRTPNDTPSSKDCETPKNQTTPNKFRAPNIKIFKTPRTEDKEKKRDREQYVRDSMFQYDDAVPKRSTKPETPGRNCLKLRDGFQSLSRLLPGTKRTWSRVKLLDLAIQHITEIQELLKDYEVNENTGQPSPDTNVWLGSTSDQESGPVSLDHVVPRSLESQALEQYEFTVDQRQEEQDPAPNIYVVENPDMQLEENSIYILYPSNEIGITGSCTQTEASQASLNQCYEIVSSFVGVHDSANCKCASCTVGGSEQFYSFREQDSAVDSIERYRFSDNYVQMVPAMDGQYVSELSETEVRREPEVLDAPESEERTPLEGQNLSEREDILEEQGQSEMHGREKQPEIHVKVVCEGGALGHDEEEANSVKGTSCLEWNSSPPLRDYITLTSLGSPGELQDQGSPRLHYTTGPSLTELLSSPVILVPEVHSSLSEPRQETHDQELPCSPHGVFYSNVITKDLSPFVVPQSPEGLSLVVGGSPEHLQLEDFSQSTTSQESQSTTYGVISEDALNYIGAAVSPFATPRLGFLPSFTELSPSQVIPQEPSVQEGPTAVQEGLAAVQEGQAFQEGQDGDAEPNVAVTEVTDFTAVGLISVAASVEIPAGNTRKTQRKPRKRKNKNATPTGGKKQSEDTKKARKSPGQKKSTKIILDQDGTGDVSSSPKQTERSLNEYGAFKTPSPRIRGRKMKRAPDEETSEVIDYESDFVPLCPLPKKRPRGRKPKKSQNAECKRQLINKEQLSARDLSIVPSADFRVSPDGPAKRGRKRKTEDLATPSCGESRRSGKKKQL